MIVGFLGAWATFVVFAWRDDAEYVIPADGVERRDRLRRQGKADLLGVPDEALA